MLDKYTKRYHHADDHSHCELDGHDHVHPHTHGGSQESKDEKTLKVLLVHWVNHNESHEEGFKEWAEKARQLGKNDTAENIDKAIEYLQKANEMLLEAKMHM